MVKPGVPRSTRKVVIRFSARAGSDSRRSATENDHGKSAGAVGARDGSGLVPVQHPVAAVTAGALQVMAAHVGSGGPVSVPNGQRGPIRSPRNCGGRQVPVRADRPGRPSECSGAGPKKCVSAMEPRPSSRLDQREDFRGVIQPRRTGPAPADAFGERLQGVEPQGPGSCA